MAYPDPDTIYTINNVHYPVRGPATIDFRVCTYDYAPFGYGVDRDGPSRTITYQCDGAIAPFLVDSLTGVGVYSTPPYQTPGPHQYPNNESLRCIAARLNGFIGTPKSSPFGQEAPLAMIGADYGIIPWDPIGTYWQPFFGTSYAVPWTYVTIEIDKEMMAAKNVHNELGEDVSRAPFIIPLVS